MAMKADAGTVLLAATLVEWDGQAVIVRAAALVAQLDRASDFEAAVQFYRTN
jgi:hypothetical protein